MPLLGRRRTTAPAVTAVEASPALAWPAPARLTGDDLIAAESLPSSPVELGIFDWLVDWADAMAAGRASYQQKWRADHPLIRFGERTPMD